MKKLISLFLSAALFSATVVSAAPFDTKTGILDRLGIDAALQQTIDTNFSQTVDADIRVRNAGAQNYVDGPIVVEKSVGQTFPKFDFDASFNMTPVWQFMYDYVEKGVNWLGGNDPAARADARAQLRNVGVTGRFVIEVTYTKGLSVPAEFRNATGLFGFTDNVKSAFVETVPRTETFDSANKKLTIVADVKDGMTCGELMDLFNPAIPEKSADFVLECQDTQPDDFGTYTVRGAVTGNVVIGDVTDPISNVAYNAVQEGTQSNETLLASVTINKKSQGTTGGGGGGGVYIPPTASNDIKVEFDINGNRDIIEPITGKMKVSVPFDTIRPAAIEGLTFDGWYLDPGFTTKLSGTQNIATSLVVYGRYVVTEAPAVFDGAHKAYIHGYPDGTVNPNGLMTREEITVALYRLLKDSVAEQIKTEVNDFSDVAADRWSNTTISSMSNAGYIKGYEDGTFKPANDITRAEFATLVLRFFGDTNNLPTSVTYSDIAGHWSEANIVAASTLGLFNGYEDGSFRPNEYITRAEAMAVINRITVRRSNNNSFTGDFINWPDISENDWFYADVIEATNTHDFVRIDDLMTEAWTDVSYSELIVG